MRGIELDAQFVSDWIWAQEHSLSVDPTPLNELLPIAKMNVSELLGATGHLLPTIEGAILGGSDPAAGSRHAYEVWKAKWGR
jgi:hypothetical protein